MEATLPRQANGNYLPPANTAAITGTTISSTAYNTLETDIGTELTNSLDRLGRSAMQANLPMGGNKVTGAADPTVSTDLATKNYVDTTTSSFFSTGDVKLTIKSVADAGWVLFDDGTIGSATSGASSRANADTQALFTLIFNNIIDVWAPIFTSGGGATTRAAQSSAAAAWTANCRISLTKVLGRALGVAGNNGTPGTAGTWLTGQTTGLETHTLSTPEIPVLSATGLVASSNSTSVVNGGVFGGTGQSTLSITGGGNPAVVGSSAIAVNTTTTTTISGTINAGGGSAFGIMQPISFLRAMIKL